jgi:hypothetical protein
LQAVLPAREVDTRQAPFTIVRAVQRAARWLPGNFTCLEQALVARALLKQCGIDATVAVGVKRTPTGEVSAHAWLERGGEAIMSTGEGFKCLTPGLGGEVP